MHKRVTNSDDKPLSINSAFMDALIAQSQAPRIDLR